MTNNGFIYSFDMGKDIAHFKSMPEYIQTSAESNTVDVIYESFVLPGDEDYLMSRLLAQNGLPRGFYWAAAQAIEKYLKAFLLMNGQGVKEFKPHSLIDLFNSASKIDTTLFSLDVMPHHDVQVETDVAKLLKKFTIKNFIEELERHGIEELERHGNPNNRYNTFGVEYNTGHLFAMDSLSFKLREKIGVVSIDRSFKYLNSDLIQVFENYNPWFATKENLTFSQIPNKDFPLILSASVTKLEILIKNKDNPAYSLALQWL